MASSQHVEVEAAKLLHKLIQESKDEPAKLATKLYVVCSLTSYGGLKNLKNQTNKLASLHFI
jgi:hypothetical protein